MKHDQQLCGRVNTGLEHTLSHAHRTLASAFCFGDGIRVLA